MYSSLLLAEKEHKSKLNYKIKSVSVDFSTAELRNHLFSLSATFPRLSDQCTVFRCRLTPFTPFRTRWTMFTSHSPFFCYSPAELRNHLFFPFSHMFLFVPDGLCHIALPIFLLFARASWLVTGAISYWCDAHSTSRPSTCCTLP